MSCPVPSESIDKNNESNELASIDKYPHYETLEPPGASAPEPAKVEEFEHMPRYQFRKSRSMRLALRQEDEGEKSDHRCTVLLAFCLFKFI